MSSHFTTKQQTFQDFVISHDVEEGLDELDQEKLTPLPRFKYHDSIHDLDEPDEPDEIGRTFVGFQKYFFQPSF